MRQRICQLEILHMLTISMLYTHSLHERIITDFVVPSPWPNGQIFNFINTCLPSTEGYSFFLTCFKTRNSWKVCPYSIFIKNNCMKELQFSKIVLNLHLFINIQKHRTLNIFLSICNVKKWHERYLSHCGFPRLVFTRWNLMVLVQSISPHQCCFQHEAALLCFSKATNHWTHS